MGVAHAAAVDLLPPSPEARLVLRTLDDEGHHHGFPTTVVVEGVDADIGIAIGLAAFIQIHHHAFGVFQIEHRVTPHFPVGVPGMRLIGIFDADGPVFRQDVFDLRGDLGVVQIGQEGKAALSDTHCRFSFMS